MKNLCAIMLVFVSLAACAKKVEPPAGVVTYKVSAWNYGLNAEEVDKSLAAVLAPAIQKLPNLKKMRAISRENHVEIYAEFSPEIAEPALWKAVEGATKDLPAGIAAMPVIDKLKDGEPIPEVTPRRVMGMSANFDRVKLGAIGLTEKDAGKQLVKILGGTEINASRDRSTRDELKEAILQGPSGSIPLKSVVTFEAAEWWDLVVRE